MTDANQSDAVVVTVTVPVDLFNSLCDCMEELAEDVASEIDARTQGWDVYPSMHRKRERDLEPVRRAERLLAEAREIPSAGGEKG